MNNKTFLIFCTAIITSICFKFNNAINFILIFLSGYLQDSTIFVFGPYMKSKPINLLSATIDGICYTNKMNLMLNWKWNFDIKGINVDDIKLLKQDANDVHIIYSYNKQVYDYKVDITNSKYAVNNESSQDILFEELCLLY